MAYTKIHPIRVTLGKAIDYVCKFEKTGNGQYISSVNCQYQIAEHEFEFTREEMNDRIELLAFHAVQSFKRGEVTPEQAHEIGMQTMKEFLKDEYEFIITTHVDTGIIHNHIIINSVNRINGKSFSREHNRKEFPAWAVFQDRYFRNHEDELLLYQEAVEELKKTEKTRELPNAGKLAADIKSLEEEKNKLLSGNKSIDKKLKEYDVLKNNLAKILLDEPENNREFTKQKQVQRNKEDIQI